uniref:Uncharacterized protein n=1 Tax=viral metagenome TaxID=1070528 RepID=A0A6M3L7W0_9ZZZZ
MAGLTLVTGYTPYLRALKDSGVTRVEFTAAGASGDATTIIAGVAGSRHIITGGRIASAGAEQIDILSASTVKDSIQFAAAGVKSFPAGLEMATAELLALDKGLTSAIRGWIDYCTIKDGQPLGIIGLTGQT